MNRDEQRERPAASAPQVHRKGALSLLYPQERGGGTWIGVNSRGHALALLNWYSTEDLGEKRRSRGEIIPRALREEGTESTETLLRDFDYSGMYPFRLFGIFPSVGQICEWRWDGMVLGTKLHEWERRHWFSSSWSDQSAETQRGSACEQMWRERPDDPQGWLRRLHASHIPQPGPYSICVHREDAATVSYTEVRCTGDNVEMGYLAGHPCQSSAAPEVWAIPRFRDAA